jgi:hypothetical protein
VSVFRSVSGLPGGFVFSYDDADMIDFRLNFDEGTV